MVTPKTQSMADTPAPAPEPPASGYGVDPDGISRLRQVEIESGPGAALVAESRNLIYAAEIVNRAGGGAVYAETWNERGDYTNAAVVAVTGGNNALLCRSEGDVACAYVENRGSGYDVFAAGDRPYGRADSIRLKHDVHPLKGALETIRQIAGVRFTWNKSGRQDVGFVAEHVAEHLPEAVTLERDGSATGMSYDTIVPVLVEAVKELDARSGTGMGGVPEEGLLAVGRTAAVPERCLELDGEKDWVDCGGVLPGSYTLATWVLKVGRRGALGVADTVRWSFVAATYDQTRKTLCLYRDGRRVAEAQNAAVRDSSDRSLRLGRGGLGIFRGRLAAISLWDRVLPADTVRSLMEKAPSATAPGLVEFYPGDAIEEDAAARWITGLRGGKATLHGDVRSVESGSAIAAPPGGPIVVQLLTRPVLPEHCLEFAAAGDRLDCGDVLAASHTRTAWTLDTGAGTSAARWTFLAATYDQGQKTLRVYRDGRQTTEVRNAPLRQGFARALYLGGGAFRGKIAAASVWNRVLGQAEILSLMDAAPLASAPGLVEYWPLDATREDGGKRFTIGARGRAATVSGQVRRVKSSAPVGEAETVGVQRILIEEQKGRLDRLEAELAAIRTELARLVSGR